MAANGTRGPNCTFFMARFTYSGAASAAADSLFSLSATKDHQRHAFASHSLALGSRRRRSGRGNDVGVRTGLLLGCSLAAPPALMGEEVRPNIVWIVSEDHGPQMGCYGDKFATTPDVNGLAARA